MISLYRKTIDNIRLSENDRVGIISLTLLSRRTNAIFNWFGGRGNSLPMAQAMENIKGDTSIRLVDVRSPEEYRDGHIPGSISIPLDQLSRIEQLIPDKNATIYAYCHSGSRSGMAVGALGRMGYTNAKNIGGIMSYRGQLAR